MNIVVIGTGYVGLVTGVCLAKLGHKVTMVDNDKDKITHLRNTRQSPFYEPDLDFLMSQNVENLDFSTDHSSVIGVDAVIIAVGTPKGGDVKDEMKYIHEAVEDFACYIHDRTAVIIKSTATPGTNEEIKKRLPFNEVISNPEFLREGSAIRDTLEPSRIVVGVNSIEASQAMREMYQGIDAPVVTMTPRSAEMVKHASNAYLAMKISFINEIANICKAVDADVYQVKEGMKYDRRIGDVFFEPGVGYGGSCFPKDVPALARVANEAGLLPTMLNAIDDVNYEQKRKMFWAISDYFDSLKGLHVAVLGLAFKPNTDDTRMSPALTLIDMLQRAGVTVTSHDPQAKVANVGQRDTVHEAIKDADAAVIMTEWPEYKCIDWTKMKGDDLFDGRGMYRRVTDIGGINNYYCIGRGWTVWGANDNE